MTAGIPTRSCPFTLSIITATRNRSRLLKTKALASLLTQTDLDFEWILVSDGGDPQTRALVKDTHFPFAFQFREIEHPTTDFGLCVARNVGLALAQGQYVTYLDDDNCLSPTFVETFFSSAQRNSACGLMIPQQLRRRDVLENGRCLRMGKPFVSPPCGTTVADLIAHRAMLDSNGLVHPRAKAPRWNPSYRIYCDYEYFLQCLQLNSDWGTPRLLETVLVDYVQTSEGEIGRSSFGNWADELQRLYDERERFSYLGINWAEWLPAAIARYRKKAEANQSLPAFRLSSVREVSHAE